MTPSTPEALIVEDDPTQAEIFTMALEQAGYVVTHLADGAEAVTYLDAHTPAIVVLDLNLPHVAGAEILHHLRQQPHLVHTRVMLATANPRMAEEIAEESDLVLLKPVSFSQLRELARRLRPTAPDETA